MAETEHVHHEEHVEHRGHEGHRRHEEPCGEESKSLKYGHWIDSPKEHESHHGESLATKNHEVIKQWAEKRRATPATVPGTEHNGHLGVLRFDFPGYGGRRIEHVTWDQWFRTFDDRDLTFIYQETMKDGSQSNFFQIVSPSHAGA